MSAAAIPDLFPEVTSDRVAVLRRRTWARHQHSAVVDPEDDERYTLRPTIDLCMRLAGVDHFDIDTSGCPEAHWADQWLGLQLDGTFINALTSSWRPKPICHPSDPLWMRPLVGWSNMPYSSIQDFIERSVAAMLNGELDVLLSLPPGDRCEQPFWQDWIEPYRDGRGLIDGAVSVTTRHLPGRQKFGSRGDPTGVHAGGGSAPFPSALVIWRNPKLAARREF